MSVIKPEEHIILLQYFRIVALCVDFGGHLCSIIHIEFCNDLKLYSTRILGLKFTCDLHFSI